MTRQAHIHNTLAFMSLAVCVDPAWRTERPCVLAQLTPLPPNFDLWATLSLSVHVHVRPGHDRCDEATRLPLWCSQWAASPAFPSWYIDPRGVMCYSPGGYFDGLYA